MKKKLEVVVKAESIGGRAGVSIYINGGLSKHMVEAIHLFEELRMLEALGTFEVSFEK